MILTYLGCVAFGAYVWWHMAPVFGVLAVIAGLIGLPYIIHERKYG